jgi:hypothetical protein
VLEVCSYEQTFSFPPSFKVLFKNLFT